LDRFAWFAAFSVAVLVLGVGALVARAPPTGAADAQVVIVDYAFRPANIRVKAGTTVHWVNMDGVDHTVSFGVHGDHAGAVDSGMMGHMGTFAYTFADPGTYEYHCNPHPYMTGTVVVTP
jgi:amicyanin